MPETAHPTLCRSPTGGIFGTTCAGTWNDWLPRITCLPEPTAPVVDHAEDESVDVSLLRWPDSVRVANTRRRYQQVDDLREQGLPMRVIARRLDVNFKTVRRYVGASGVDVLVAGGVQVSVLDPFKPGPASVGTPWVAGDRD